MNFNFDDAVFNKLSSSLDSLLPEVISVFFEETDVSINQLEKEILNKNLLKIHDIAHKIKSSSNTFGAIGLTDLLEQIEKVQDINSIELNTLVISIRTEFETVKNHIRTKIPISNTP